MRIPAPCAALAARIALVSLALAAPLLAAERTQVTTAVIHASADELWRAHTTPEGLVKLWGVAHAAVDFRVGGTLQTHYDEKAKLGDPGTIVHTILAYEPGRMLALATRAPENAPEAVKRWCERGWHVTRIEPLGAKLARFTVTGCGYGDDADSDAAWEFFQRGNAWEFEQMRKSFGDADGRKASDEALARLRKLAGGDFVATDELADGRKVRSHSRWSQLFGGFLVCETWLSDDAQPLRERSRTLYGLDPATGALSFWKFGEGGSIARGTALLDGERGVGHDWTLDAPGAEPRRLYVQIEPRDDGYLYRVQPSLAEQTTVARFEYRRVAELPAEFAHAAK